MEYTKNKKGFNELFIACKFVAKAESHYEISVLHVTEIEVQATDGHRGIRTQNVYGLEPGCYEIGNCTKTKLSIYPIKSPGNFPGFDGVFPGEPKPGEPMLEEVGSTTAGSGSYIGTILYKLAKHNKCINPDFIKPLLDTGKTFLYFVKEEYSPVYFENELAKIVIMPLDVEYEASKTRPVKPGELIEEPATA